MQCIHLNQARKILDARRPVDLGWWTQRGEVRRHTVQSLRYDWATGTRNVRIHPSGQIRKLSDIMIFEINGLEVFI